MSLPDSTPSPLGFDAIFSATASAYLILDPGLVIVAVNDSYLRATERSRETLLGRYVFDAFPANPLEPGAVNVQKLHASFRQVLETGTADRIDFLKYDIPIGPGGSGPFEERYWSPINTPVFDAGGKLVHIIHHAEDITSRVMSEAALRQSERSFRALTNATADVIYRMSADWTWMHELDGRGFLKDTEAHREYRIEDYVPEIDRELARNAIAQAIRTKTTFELEHRVILVDGSIGWTYSKAVPLLEPDGSIREWIGSASDITARKRAEEQLKDSHQRKDEFLAMLAHELRNPLAPISAAAKLLQMSGQDAERLRRTSQIIERQAAHMTHLVDDLLDVSRVTRGLVELEKLALDIRHVVVEAVEQATPLIQARRHTLTLQLQPDTTMVLGDHKRLVQVLANLLNNAAKYTPDGGHILVAAEARQAHVVLEVSDDGMGMTADLAARAFDLFSQAQRSSDRSAGGLGLGLALVKNLVELHGGTVQCASAGLGAGSSFTLCLPRLETAAPCTPGQGAQPGYPGSAPLRIMVVDDNVDAADMLGMMLEALGHRVALAHGSHEAIGRAGREAFDVFLLDIGLPEMDGNALAQRLRSQGSDKSVFIAVTGYGQDADRARTRAAGFDHHLVKPLDLHQLAAILAAARPS